MNFLKLVLTFCALFLISSVSAQIDSAANQIDTLVNQKSKPRIITVSSSLQHISDIDFVKREYKMELWLKFQVDSTDKCALSNIDEQISIKEAKEITIDTIPTWLQSTASCDDKPMPKLSRFTKILRVRCTMIQDWNVKGYPFDRQSLDITIYNPQLAARWIVFIPKDSLIHYYAEDLMDKDTASIEIENGWVFLKDSARVAKKNNLLADPFQDNYYEKDKNKPKEVKQYSSIHYIIPMYRTEKGFLFIKLLVGMYVAFFVAFIALFINMDNAEVRFSLPVGGLFAAIANKYIIESILPQSPDFTMVDWLHSVTIIFILLIIAYSARDLYLIKKAKEKGANPKLTSSKKVAAEFALFYLLITIILIVVNTQ